MKQCRNATSRNDCNCSRQMMLSDEERFSDCKCLVSSLNTSLLIKMVAGWVGGTKQLQPERFKSMKNQTDVLTNVYETLPKCNATYISKRLVAIIENFQELSIILTIALTRSCHLIIDALLDA